MNRVSPWLSADPIGEEGGINLYEYVGNSPINGWDPLGLEAECDLNPHHLDEDGMDKWGTDWGRANYRNYQEGIHPQKGLYQVVGHGTERFLFDDRKKGDRPLLSIKLLIKVLAKENSEKWKSSDKVKLHSCSTGKGDNSIAQLLADLTGKQVIAPTDKLGTDGKVKNGGKWEIFHPREPGKRPPWVK